MSVQVNTYIMLGIVLDYEYAPEREQFEQYFDNAFEPVRAFSEITCLFDGMGGKYVAFGFVHKRTDDDSHFDGVIELPEISRDHLALMERELARAVPPDTKYQHSRWLVISHYR